MFCLGPFSIQKKIKKRMEKPAQKQENSEKLHLKSNMLRFFQICTDTTSYQGPQMRARTSVNVVWKMKGMDVKLDTKIGSYLTTLVDTMTLITGNQARRTSESDKFEDSTTMDELDGLQSDEFDGTPKRVKKPSKTPTKSKNKEQNLKEKSRKLEYQYNEQVGLSNIFI